MSDTIKLPPLPNEWTKHFNVRLWNGVQMQYYASTAVELNMSKVPHDTKLDEMIDVLRSHVGHLVKNEAADALTALRRSRDGWKADCEREAGNVVYWRERAERAEAQRDAYRSALSEVGGPVDGIPWVVPNSWSIKHADAIDAAKEKL